MSKYNVEWKLDAESFGSRLISVCREFGIDNPGEVAFYSQQDEDKYIIQYFLDAKINDGVFLEVGACDGVLYSNTKTLEDHFGFSGILIEPQQNFYEKLIVNRPNCECYNCAVSSETDETVEFFGNDAEGGISRTLHKRPPPKKRRNYFHWRSWLSMMRGEETEFFKVRNKRMADVLKHSAYEYIDFMFVDVEGGELDLLKSMDFTIPVFCIVVEAHSNQEEKNQRVRDFLLAKGFFFKQRQQGNEVWVNPNYFRRRLFCAQSPANS